MHVVCSVMVKGFLSGSCDLLSLLTRVLSFPHWLSRPMLAPQKGDHHALIIHFTEVNSPFSTASAGSPHLPFSSPFSPRFPLLACVQPSVVYWTEHLVGLAFHHSSCWHHVPPPQAAGRRHARHCCTHPPAVSQRTLASFPRCFAWPWFKPVALTEYRVPA